ncbi:hypothetical protein [Virgibacillus sp. YIM 98842]|uniref:hypothetical protein n=1 Tax=Virgibacillus sp. YIM 98842 TaxID=2663533 RepID=UPI0013D930A1|nr:hypothetical protein [Virgibacillus sp. YIM 98842]
MITYYKILAPVLPYRLANNREKSRFLYLSLDYQEALTTGYDGTLIEIEALLSYNCAVWSYF